MLISIETHITCDFPGGGGVGTPYPPLDLHMLHRLFFRLHLSKYHIVENLVLQLIVNDFGKVYFDQLLSFLKIAFIIPSLLEM